MITDSLSAAKEALNNNDIVAIPTETVYGLAGNAFNETAIKKIFELKKRPLYNPLIVHIKSVDYLSEVAAEVPPMAKELAKAFWPGPLTLILKKQAHIPDLITAGKDTVAVRMPNHPVTLELLKQLDFPLAAPSANPFGSISPTSAKHVDGYFKENLKVVLDGGECEKGLESTIIGFQEGKAILYRHGAIPIADIEKITGKLSITSKNDSDPTAPGMLSKHYSPKTNSYLTANVLATINQHPDKKIGVLVFKDAVSHPGIHHQEILSEGGSMDEAAQKLYAALHRLDQLNLDLIIAEKFPDEGLGKTINDRLQRAVERSNYN